MNRGIRKRWDAVRGSQRFRIAAVGLIATIAVIIAVFLHLHQPYPPYHLGKVFDGQNRQQAIARFQREIHALGGKKAYDRLNDAVAGLSVDDQHEYGHLFGNVLYKEEGLAGISVCDTRLSYGCFHEFLSDALIQYGPGSVQMLDDKCSQVLKSASLSCQHGLGHGILSSIGLNQKGYDQAHLVQALNYCQSLKDDHPLGGCDGGVYMEYNLHTVFDVEYNTNSIRHPDPNDIYAPCDSLQQSLQSTCYFWLTQWWAAAGAIHYVATINTIDDDYRYVGQLCSKLTGESLRRCFEGIGYSSVSSAASNPQQMRQLCLESSSDKKNQLFCRAFAANMLTNIPGSSGRAPVLCTGLTGSSYSFCMDYVNNKGNFFTTLPDPSSVNG